MAQPLSNIDRITVVSTGNDGAAGVSKITGDMTKIAAQVPALFEALSGMDMSQLLGKIKTIKGSEPPVDGDGSGKRAAGAGKQ
jgi:flotillin